MATTQQTRKLLTTGIVAGPCTMVISFARALIIEGFHFIRHANSLLVLGEWGWLQTINFIVFGILVTFAALGVRQALHGKPSGVGSALLLAIYGLGCIIVGLAPTDPGFGPKWDLGANVSVSNLRGDAADSPITLNKTQTQFSLFAAYRF